MVTIFCDFSYLTAHTDSEGDSEEEKECMKLPNAITKSEVEEELFSLLHQVDNLHKGSEDDKKEGFRLLLEKNDKVLMGKLLLLFCFVLLLRSSLIKALKFIQEWKINFMHVFKKQRKRNILRWCKYSCWVGIEA